MALNDAFKHNFQTLLDACDDENVCLMECTDKKTGEIVPVVCAVQPSGDPEHPIETVPLAKLFTGNPYEEVDPPK